MGKFKNSISLTVAVSLLVSLKLNSIQAAAVDQTTPSAPNAENSCHDVCSTSSCQKEAKFYQDNMNLTVNPCDDFFQFVCGKFLEREQIPDDQNDINMISKAIINLQADLLSQLKSEIQSTDVNSTKKLKTFYHNCMDESGIEAQGAKPLLEIVEKLGGWPVVVGDKWKEAEFKWEETVAKISSAGFLVDFPFSVLITEDSSDSTKKIIDLASAKTRVTDAYLLPDSKNLKAYEDYILDIAVLLGANKDQASKEVKELVELETKLQKNKLPLHQLLEMDPIANRRTIGQLSTNYSGINWLGVINNVLNPSQVFVNESESVEVEDPKYFKEIGNILQNTSKRTIANYQIWDIINSAVDYLPKEFTDKQLEFKKVTEGLNNKSTRETFCVTKIMESLQIALSAMYVRKYFNKQIKDNIIELVEDIKKQAKENLEKVDWMDEKTRAAALEKLKSMGAEVAYPDPLLDDAKVEEFYHGLEINPGPLINSVVNISSYTKNFKYQKLRYPPGTDDWTLKAEVAVINAYYHPGKNGIILPAGILKGFFYEFERPKFLNYGSMGYIIGHEVTHGFDSYGRKYDKSGNFKNWWEPTTEEKFTKKAQCIIDQYSNYTIAQIGMKMNGKLTQIENIADNGGIKLAYHAYNSWLKRNNVVESCLPGLSYSPQQMFWISAATTWCGKSKSEFLRNIIHEDFHSPSEPRVTLAFRNINEFANDFKCKSGSPMNPEHKCNIW